MKFFIWRLKKSKLSRLKFCLILILSAKCRSLFFGSSFDLDWLKKCILCHFHERIVLPILFKYWYVVFLWQNNGQVWFWQFPPKSYGPWLFNNKFVLEFSMTFIFTELVHISVFSLRAGQLNPASWCGIFSLCCRPNICLRLVSAFWLGRCLFYSFSNLSSKTSLLFWYLWKCLIYRWIVMFPRELKCHLKIRIWPKIWIKVCKLCYMITRYTDT